MAVTRTQNFKSLPLNIVGSSVFGRYPKISQEHTYNMYISQNFLVPYAGYKIGISDADFGLPTNSRSLYRSIKLGFIIAVFDDQVYSVRFEFNQLTNEIEHQEIGLLGVLNTSVGPVFISENNKPQICISDGTAIYVYDPSATKIIVTGFTQASNTITYTGSRALIMGEPIEFSGTTLPGGVTAGVKYFVSITGLTDTKFQITDNITDAFLGLSSILLTGTGPFTGSFKTFGEFQAVPITFTPGHIDFHDTYMLCAARNDTFYDPAANNTWRLSAQNNCFVWPDTPQTIGLLETKPDNTQAIFRFPSAGNMIWVMGESVAEAWFDTGGQLFPYQRNDQYNIDYGCVNPDTIAHLNNITVWLGFNEKSGPIIMFSDGGIPQKITTDGIDFLFSQLQDPKDSTAFIYRQDGHTIYHINFHSDNLSLFYDFETKKFFNACDQNLNVYDMDEVVFYKNQYFSISSKDANFYIFDTTLFTYKTVDSLGKDVEHEIPRIRSCSNIRLPTQDYFIVNDIGFTIESGETNYQLQEFPNSDEIPYTLITEAGDTLISESGDAFVTEQLDPSSGTTTYRQYVPRVDLALSYNGGASFDSYYGSQQPPIGKRRNRLMWWQGGICNDLVVQIKFWGIGRFVATDGIVNIRM